MNYDESDMMYGMGEGCPYHGEQFMQECSMCGAEYCARCHAGSVCPECASTQGEQDEEAGPASAEAGDDEPAVDRLLREAEELPAEGPMFNDAEGEEDR